jgi:hypothetical protein
VEGVAGLAWASGGTVLLEDLPDLSRNPSDDLVLEYARQARVPERWIRHRLRKNKPCPRCLCAVPVEVGGKPWGVIVLDGREPRRIQASGHTYKAYGKIVPMFLGELLQRL